MEQIGTSIKHLNFHETPEQRFLIIYTGGTIGMRVGGEGVLTPFNFDQFVELIPELTRFKHNFSVCSFDTLIDSADMNPTHWIAIAQIIEKQYESFDGFIVLQGTDTMAYAASCLSFLLENIHKPVIFTGAQLPIGAIRNDARKNLISSIEIASERENGQPVLQEVAIFFGELLVRGNRSRKEQSMHLDAFHSENYPQLAHAGVYLDFNKSKLYRPKGSFKVYNQLCEDVLLVKLYPGMQTTVLAQLLKTPHLKGVVLETYGAGNAPSNNEFISVLEQFIQKGGVVVNVSQCDGGEVIQKLYQTGNKLDKIGVISGGDMTAEAALTKLMFVLANTETKEVLNLLKSSLRGEITL